MILWIVINQYYVFVLDIDFKNFPTLLLRLDFFVCVDSDVELPDKTSVASKIWNKAYFKWKKWKHFNWNPQFWIFNCVHGSWVHPMHKKLVRNIKIYLYFLSLPREFSILQFLSSVFYIPEKSKTQKNKILATCTRN